MPSQHPSANILGRLLVLQQTLELLPDENSMSKFLAAAILNVPGVSSCNVDIHGKDEDGAVLDDENTPVVISIRTPRTVFGHIWVGLDDKEAFKVYQPVIENIGQVVGTSLENKWNALRLSEANSKLEQLVNELEQKVEERTQDINRARNALAESEERWKFALQGAGEGIWDWNPQTDEALFSDGWQEMIGYVDHDFPGNGAAWVAHLHPKDRGRVLDAVNDYFSGKRKDYSVEFRFRCKDGSWKWVLARGRVMDRDANGRPIRMVGTHVDITAQKETERRLQHESEANRALLHNASDGIHILDYEGNVLEASESFCSMLGYLREEVIGMNVSQWDAHFTESGELMKALKGQFEKPARSQFETKHRRKDGTVFDVEVTGYPLELDGKPVLFNSSRDISRRKAVEAELAASNAKLQGLYELSPIGIALTDMQGHYLQFNKAFEIICGYTRDELNKLDYWSLTPKKYAEQEEEQLRSLRKKGMYGPYEKEYIRKDGSLVPLRLNGALIHDLDGQAYIWSMVEDISALKKAELETRIAATAFESQEGMMITDAQANILRVNSAFTGITGFTSEEVIGKNPRILQSGRQNDAFYQAMWKSINGTGHWFGEIWNRRKSGEIYPEYLTITAVKNSVGEITNYVASLSDITHRKAAEEQIQHLAFYDHLTDLPNRRLFMDRSEQAQRESARTGKHGALMLIDLDNFKTLNDTLGHAMGDLLLKQVAGRLKLTLREGDTVARLGGDEFVVLLTGLSEVALKAAEEVEAIGRKIFLQLTNRYQLESHSYEVSPSIGITLFEGEKTGSDELIKQADIAMYEAKRAGRNTMRFYDARVQEAIHARASLETDLRQALIHEQLELYYQIQVNHDGNPIGAEALVRWNHPERGLVMPAKFIPIAEETGLILPLGEWVLEAACRQLKAWEKNRAAKHLILAINVSARQFYEATFVDEVRQAVERNSINPSLLKLELTEGMLLDDIDEAVVAMYRLRDIGIRLSLDDFGTGYSSLAYLKRLPLNQLKIDQSFVRDLGHDLNDRAIVQTIIAVAAHLNLAVLAEGVETEEQKQFLGDNGCCDYQGYLFGKPIPIDQFEALLDRR